MVDQTGKRNSESKVETPRVGMFACGIVFQTVILCTQALRRDPFGRIDTSLEGVAMDSPLQPFENSFLAKFAQTLE
jgi:hypothetical protein